MNKKDPEEIQNLEERRQFIMRMTPLERARLMKAAHSKRMDLGEYLIHCGMFFANKEYLHIGDRSLHKQYSLKQMDADIKEIEEDLKKWRGK